MIPPIKKWLKFFMLRKNIVLIFVSVVALSISGCETLQLECLLECMTGGVKPIEDGATRLNPDQVKIHISGNTEIWFKGGAYYSPDGELKVKWRKAWNTGIWKVSAEGEVCITTPKLGNPCYHYMNNAGAITMVSEGKNVGVKEMLEGNKLRGL